MVGLSRRLLMMPRSQSHYALIGKEKNERYTTTTTTTTNETCYAKEGLHYVALLKECAKRKDLKKGISLHIDILNKDLLRKNPYVGSTLVSMYAKCGALEKAQEVLDELPYRNVISWSALIAGYAEHEECHKTFNCVEQMRSEGLAPDAVTFTAMLKACGRTRSIDKGREIHIELVKFGLEGSPIIGATLLHMYGKHGSLVEAESVFNKLAIKDVVTWTTLMFAYVQNELGDDALWCFEQMQIGGICPNAIAFFIGLKACVNTGSMDKAQEIHTLAVKQGMDMDLVFGDYIMNVH